MIFVTVCSWRTLQDILDVQYLISFTATMFSAETNMSNSYHESHFRDSLICYSFCHFLTICLGSLLIPFHKSIVSAITTSHQEWDSQSAYLPSNMRVPSVHHLPAGPHRWTQDKGGCEVTKTGRYCYRPGGFKKLCSYKLMARWANLRFTLNSLSRYYILLQRHERREGYLT
jgi:hypothetical protein